MDQKLQIKVLKFGPAQDSQDELDCAAWLIKNDFAEGSVLPDHTQVGEHTAAVRWNGRTPKGDRELSRSNIVQRVFSSKIISRIIVGVAVAVISFVIISYLPSTNQTNTQVKTQQKR